MAIKHIAVVLVMLAGCREPDPGTSGHNASLGTSAEIELAPVTLGPAPGLQRLDAMFQRGDGYGALWVDSRESLEQVGFHSRAFFARVAADGSVLDPTGVPLGPPSPAFGDQLGIVGACRTADDCMFVATGDLSARTLVGVRVTGDQVLDPTPKLLLDVGPSSVVQNLSIAWDGAAFRLSWTTEAPGQLWTASLATDGTLGAQVLVSPTFWPSHVACERPRCLIVYATGDSSVNTTIHGRVIDAMGALGPELELYPAGQNSFESTPVWDGQRYWLTVGNTADLSVVRVAPGGALVDPSPLAIGAPGVLDVRIVHDGTNAIVLWGLTDSQGSNVRAARIDDHGAVLDPGGVAFAPRIPVDIRPDLGFPFQATCQPGQCLATWTQASYLDQRVRGARFDGLTELDPGGFDIATSPPGTAAAAATFGLGNYVAVWRDSRDSSQDFRVAPIRGAVFSPSMAPLAPIELGPATPPMPDVVCPDQDQPTVAASASSYMVVWHEACQYYDNLYGQVVGGTGQPLAPAFVVDDSSGKETHPSLASDGTTFLAVWDNTAAPVEIQGRRFAATGAPLGPAFTIAPSGHIPVVAFDGTNYLVVWRRTNSGQRDLYATHVTPTGTVLGPETTIAQTTAGEEGQSVACGGGTCLVAWRGAQIRVARVAPDGTMIDPGGIVVATATGPTPATSVAWDGAVFVVTWQTGNELRAARIATTGALLTTTHATIAAPATPPDRPAIVSNGAGHLVALYDRYDATSAFHVRRVRALSIVDDDPQPPVDAGVPGDAARDALTTVDASVDAPTDAAAPDAATPDAATPDAAAPDAATPDAATPDAATPDALTADAATLDAAEGPTPDAGTPPTHGGCDAGHGDATLFAWLIALAPFVARRRRSIASRPARTAAMTPRP